MTRPTLRRPDQPVLVRVVLGLFEFFASLPLAVVLIFTCAVVLAGATFLESHYGSDSKVVYFGIYHTWWFALLNFLLGLNVLCAALIRFPWKKSQTGFVVTHTGIIVLLVGTLLSRLGGVDASLKVFEGESAWRAQTDTQHFRLSVDPLPGASGSTPHGATRMREIITIPFVGGPFNWEKYRQWSWVPWAADRLWWFPWCLSRRHRGVLFNRDGIKLEVLDYYADASLRSIPRLKLLAAAGGGTPSLERSGSAVESIELAIDATPGPHGERPYAMREHASLAGGQQVAFWMTDDPDETAAFRDAAPEGLLGQRGQIVLHAGGKKFRFPVDRLPEGKPQPLGDTGLTVELVAFQTELLGVQLRIRHGDDPPQTMFLLAQEPQFNRHDYRNRVFGDFWCDAASSGAEPHPPAEPATEPAAPRIDILQGADGKLWCRAWQATRVEPTLELPTEGQRIELWKHGGAPLTLAVDEFTPSDRPGRMIAPEEFHNKSPALKQPAALVRLTVDETTEEFWLAGIFAEPEGLALPPEQRHIVQSKSRQATVVLPWAEIDIGFQVHLRKFEIKLDPGTSQPSYFASLVDFLDHPPTPSSRPDSGASSANDPAVLREKVLITLNEPVTFSNPRTRRSYRLYQDARDGPFRPGHPTFEQHVNGGDLRKELYASVLAVNYDPGRGLKYAGCLLIVVGTVLLFYMKGFFFRKGKSH